MTDTFPMNRRAIETVSEKIASLGVQGREALGTYLLRTAINMHREIVKGIQSGGRSGRTYEWMADLPGRSGEGPVFLMMGGWDLDLYTQKKAEGFTVMIKMPDNSGGHWIPVKQRSKGAHQSSAPGEKPKSDTGQMVSHIHWLPTSLDTIKERLQVELGVMDLVYPKMLETGTKFMEKRPWLGPVVDKYEKDVEQNVKRIVEGSLE